MTMSHDDLVSKQAENAEHIQNVSINLTKLGEQMNLIWKVFGLIGLIIGITWWAASYVNKQNNTTIDFNAKFDEIKKRQDGHDKHEDAKFQEVFDSINSIKHTQLLNFNSVNKRLDQHDYSLKTISEKSDKVYNHFFTEHKNTPTSDPTFVRVQ